MARALVVLAFLELRMPQIPDGCWARLLAAPWASRLCILQLFGQDLGTRGGASGAGLRALAGAPLPALVDLKTGNALLTPADLSGTLAAAPWLGQLTRLHFAVEWLGAAGLAALASLRLPRLQHLTLNAVGTTEAGLVALGAAPWLPRLTRLEFKQLAPLSVSAEGHFEFGDELRRQASVCDNILEGRSEGNPFAPLARAGVIEKDLYFHPGLDE
jgi:hypothetical protein